MSCNIFIYGVTSCERDSDFPRPNLGLSCNTESRFPHSSQGKKVVAELFPESPFLTGTRGRGPVLSPPLSLAGEEGEWKNLTRFPHPPLQGGRRGGNIPKITPPAGGSEKAGTISDSPL